jgi:hypothetical protein
MWEPRHLTALKASTACYRDSFCFIYSNEFNISILFYTEDATLEMQNKIQDKLDNNNNINNDEID